MVFRGPLIPAVSQKRLECASLDLGTTGPPENRVSLSDVQSTAENWKVTCGRSSAGTWQCSLGKKIYRLNRRRDKRMLRAALPVIQKYYGL